MLATMHGPPPFCLASPCPLSPYLPLFALPVRGHRKGGLLGVKEEGPGGGSSSSRRSSSRSSSDRIYLPTALPAANSMHVPIPAIVHWSPRSHRLPCTPSADGGVVGGSSSSRKNLGGWRRSCACA